MSEQQDSRDIQLGLMEIAVAIHKVAEAIGLQAQATHMLARATAGEFDQGSEDDTPQYDLSGRPLV